MPRTITRCYGVFLSRTLLLCHAKDNHKVLRGFSLAHLAAVPCQGQSQGATGFFSRAPCCCAMPRTITRCYGVFLSRTLLLCHAKDNHKVLRCFSLAHLAAVPCQGQSQGAT